MRFILYLVLESTCFLRCVLYPGESLHVFSTVLTRLQVRFDNTLSDALCETKNKHKYIRAVLFTLFSSDGSRFVHQTEREREGWQWSVTVVVYISTDHGSVTLNYQLNAMQHSISRLLAPLCIFFFSAGGKVFLHPPALIKPGRHNIYSPPLLKVPRADLKACC